MKNTINLITFFLVVGTAIAQPSLTKIWTSDASLPVPESVLVDPKENCLWVSCIDGKPTEKDGKGHIAQLKPDGRIIDRQWVTGLNAPKGMARFGKYLFVTDITDLVIIDIGERKIEKRIAIEGAQFLNDVSAGEDGSIYFSDMNTGKIHRWKDDVVTDFLTNLKAPNGILSVGNTLFFVDSGKLMKHQAGTLSELASGMDGSTDGLEMIRPGEFLISAWTGHVYWASDKGKVKELLNTSKKNSQTADIGFDSNQQILFVPTFYKNTVEAYQLK